MARRYTRDNRGRFSSAGATARGGRLATASGNKRATQTATTAKRATPSGAIRRSDVVTARVQNGISKNIERRNKAGLNPSTAGKESKSARIARAERRITARSQASAKTAKPDAPVKGSLAANKMEMAKGRSAVLGKQKDSLNKQLREVNAKIKEAGPSAGAYRLQKLQIQSRLSETRSALGKSQTASGTKAASKANAKQQAQVDGLKQKVARMRRAQSRFEATADTRNQPGSKMVRRPDAKTSRGNRRTEQARAIYMGASMQKMSNFAQGVARTSKARNNWMQPRSARVAQAKRAGLPLITVTGYKNRK